jgi:hypothetical protein
LSVNYGRNRFIKSTPQEWLAAPDSLSADDADFRSTRAETRKVFAEKLAKNLRRRSLSESLVESSFKLDLLSDGIRDQSNKSYFHTCNSEQKKLK